MKNEEYGLYFEGKNKEGKKEKILLLKGRIDLIDMYTCYCKDGKELLDFLPTGASSYYLQSGSKKNTPNVKGYIYDNFSDDINMYDNTSEKYVDNHFYIKRVSGKKLKERFDILYWKDRDIVYINRSKESDKSKTKKEKESEIYYRLCDLSLTISECNDARIKSLENDDIKKYRIRYKFFVDVLNDVKERNPRLIDMFERNITFSNDLDITKQVYALASIKKNLKLLSEEIKRDAMLRRKLAIKIKDTLKKLDDIDNKKTRMLAKEETNKRHNERHEYYFSLRKVYEVMDELFEKHITKNNKIEEEIRVEKEEIPNIPEHLDESILDNAIMNETYIYEDDEPFLGPESEGDIRYKRY